MQILFVLYIHIVYNIDKLNVPILYNYKQHFFLKNVLKLRN